MSVEHLKAYGKKIAEDEEVKKRAKDIGLNDLDGQIAYGKELGFEFTVDDMRALAEEVGVTEDELSEEQLERIAGGAATTTAVVVGATAATAVGAVGVSAAAVGAVASEVW